MNNLNKYNINKKRKNGFTIVEVVTVLGILSILCVVLIPSFLGIIDDTNAQVIEEQTNVVNDVLEYEDVAREDVNDVNDVFEILEEYGLFDSIDQNADHLYVWDAKTNQIIHVNEEGKVIFYSEEYSTNTFDWHVFIFNEGNFNLATNMFTKGTNYYIYNNLVYSSEIILNNYVYIYGKEGVSLTGNLTLNSEYINESFNPLKKNLDIDIIGDLQINYPNAVFEMDNEVNNLHIEAVGQLIIPSVRSKIQQYSGLKLNNSIIHGTLTFESGYLLLSDEGARINTLEITPKENDNLTLDVYAPYTNLLVNANKSNSVEINIYEPIQNATFNISDALDVQINVRAQIGNFSCNFGNSKKVTVSNFASVGNYVDQSSTPVVYNLTNNSGGNISNIKMNHDSDNATTITNYGTLGDIDSKSILQLYNYNSVIGYVNGWTIIAVTLGGQTVAVEKYFYPITSVDEYNKFASLTDSQKDNLTHPSRLSQTQIRIMNNIDFMKSNSSVDYFHGDFVGNNYNIYNLSNALFGIMNSYVDVKDVKIHAQIHKGEGKWGAVANQAIGTEMTFTNVHIYGSLKLEDDSTTSAIGGFIGYSKSSGRTGDQETLRFVNSSFNAELNVFESGSTWDWDDSWSYGGGFVGYANWGAGSDCVKMHFDNSTLSSNAKVTHDRLTWYFYVGDYLGYDQEHNWHWHDVNISKSDSHTSRKKM